MYKYLIIFVLIVVVLLLLNSRSGNVITSVITHRDTLYHDTTIVKYKKGSDIVYKIIDSVPNSVQIYIHDTAYIVNDYNKIKVYTDTLRINTDNSVYIIDTISQNRILGRSYKADLREKTIVVTNDIYHEEKKSIYLGPVLDIRRFDNKIGIGVGLMYKPSKSQLIGLNLTTNQISAGYYIKF
jgi:hypothetical protein